ncbi:hypothetical protein [Mesorhizobium sp. NZP2298]|uniref:hypothetical protein n=1 Tax=Mesorhizobium sp. NZP2298 TaxID=2483403 RepID=UPI00155478DF|nr:hypothetical protein [Mesorhizobium sp. NZP2298]QKC97273.1 hypothetical protein EB231_23255 [Mesorhizobium sp. NZP2298]
MQSNIEKADTARTRTTSKSRRIKLPGKPLEYTDTDPIKIARELRAKSALGRAEAKLERK